MSTTGKSPLDESCWAGPGGCHADALETRVTQLVQQRDQLLSQLPDGMKDCTIQFKECPLGHGRLTATNWVDHGCAVCATERKLTLMQWHGKVEALTEVINLCQGHWAKEPCLKLGVVLRAGVLQRLQALVDEKRKENGE